MERVLRDKNGNRLGVIRTEGNYEVVRDKAGNKLAYFDGRYTRDIKGNKVGEGNLLVTFIF